jgi:hypothetical protein
MILPWSVARVAVTAGFRSGILVSCAGGVLMMVLLWGLVARSHRPAAPTGALR